MFCSEPPRDINRTLTKIVRCQPGKVLPVVICQRQIVGVMTHWTGNTTVMCQKPNVCHLCDRQLAIWKGYIICKAPSVEKYALVQITPNVVESLRAATEPTVGLLGLSCAFRRLGKRQNSPLTVDIGLRLPDVREWPVARTEEILTVLYRAAEKKTRSYGSN